MDGTYEAIVPTAQGWRWSQQLGLYLGIYQEKLRFFTPAGDLVLSPEETAEAERQKAEAERQKNERLRAKLRELGVDPDVI